MTKFASLLVALLLCTTPVHADPAPAYRASLLYTYAMWYGSGAGFNNRRDFGAHYTSDYPGGFDVSWVQYANGEASGLTLFGGHSSHLSDLNDVGDAVGWSTNDPQGSAAHPIALLNRSLIQLDADGQPIVYADAISNHQQIAGTVRTPGGSLHGALIEHGGFHDLGTLGGDKSYASALNDNGQILGSAQTAQGEWHSFLYENGSMIDLNSQPGFPGGASLINNEGVIAGSFYNGQWNAFLYRDQQLTLLAAGAGSSGVNGLNNEGEAIGLLNGAPFVWHGGQRFDLLGAVGNPQPYDFRYFLGLNDSGEILYDGCSYQLQACAFVLLTPVPEPSPASMAALGLALLALWRRKQQRRTIARKSGSGAPRPGATRSVSAATATAAVTAAAAVATGIAADVVRAA